MKLIKPRGCGLLAASLLSLHRTLLSILLVFSLFLIGCASFVKVIQIDEDTAKKMRADVKYYDMRDLDSISYETIQPIEATSCKRNIWDPAASKDNAIDQLRYLAKSYGGNAITKVLCSGSEGTSLSKNCWDSIVCKGVAIRVLEPSSILADSQKQRTQVSKQRPNILPAQVLIPGVPFISWQEAARLKYHDKNIVNPSVAAMYAMILEFWGKDRKILERADFETELNKFNTSSTKISKVWTTTDLKASIARGVPVYAGLPLTPAAHPLYLTFEMGISLGQIKGVELIDKGRPRSGALGRMVSLKDLRKIKEQMNQMNPINESVYAAARLVIGYDDDRRVFIVHDPSFGPAFEISYDDFDKMWEAVDRQYLVMSPKDYSERVPGKNLSHIYRDRTPDEQAATHFVYGYGLDCLGRLDEAEEHFKNGLAILGISKGYEFLIRFELALNLGERGDFVHAIAEAEKAKALAPEHALTWDYLAKAYMASPGKGNLEEANEAEKKAKTLQKDQQALKIVARTLPSDFWIQYLAPIRGWGGETTLKEK